MPELSAADPEPVLRRGTHQGETATHAEADDPDVVAGVVRGRAATVGGGDVLEGAAVAALQRLEGRLRHVRGRPR